MKRLFIVFAFVWILLAHFSGTHLKPHQYALVSGYDERDRIALIDRDYEVVAASDCDALAMWHNRSFPETPKPHCERIK